MTKASEVISRVCNDTSEECWLWAGALTSAGYGSLKIENNVIAVHRLSYTIYYEESIEPDLKIHHKCFNKSCYNPRHLQKTTHQENLSLSPHWRSTKTTCPQGHDYDYISKSGARRCRQCSRESARKSYNARK